MASQPRTNYAFTKVSSNRKIGPMSCTMTDKKSCSDSCSYKDGGCYALAFPLSLHWSKLDHAGMTVEELAANHLKRLPKRNKCRINQAGDFRQNAGVIDTEDLGLIVEASSHIDVIAYTHHDPLDFTNHDAILWANKQGFTVNLSAESLVEADFYADLGIAPVVVAVPRGTPKVTHTAKGRQVTMCPAVYSDMTCDRCMICAKSERKSIIAFEAHGTSAAKVERIFWARSAT